MLDKILNGKASTIASAAFIIGLASFASRILGMVRDRIVASTFGAGDNLDAYFAAFRIPDTLFTLIVLGALSAGFIPLMTELMEKNSDRAWRYANNVLNILIVSLVIFGITLFIFAPWLMQIITPGFTGEKLDLTVSLTRVLFLSPLILGVSSLFGGVLQSFKRFVAVSIAPMLYNLGIIIGALFLTPYFGVHGLVYGVIIGTILHLVIQIYPVSKLGFNYKLIFDWRDSDFIETLKLMAPRAFSLGITALTAIVLTALASSLDSGSVTLYNFALNIQALPFGIFGVSFAIAAFPTLAEYASSNDKKSFTNTITTTTRQILFFMIPLTALFIILRAQIVRVVLGGGAFDWPATIAAANLVGIFAISLFAQSLIQLYSRAFFALKDSQTPFIASIFNAALTIGLAWYFILNPSVLPFHVSALTGLAWAYSIGVIAQLCLMAVLLRLKVGNLGLRQVSWSALKILAATFVMSLAVQFMKFGVEPYFGTDTFLGIFLQGFISGSVGIAVFVAFGIFINLAELNTFLGSIKKKIFKEKPGLGQEEGIDSGVEQFGN